MSYPITTIILAAGKGTRMPSKNPKALQTVLGEAMLSHVYSVAQNISDTIWTVIGYKADMISDYLTKNHGEKALQHTILQDKQLGTGHAVQCAMQKINENNTHKSEKILILNADVPLISTEILTDFITKAEKYPLSFISLYLPDAKSYGRVARQGFMDKAKNTPCTKHEDNNGEVVKIIEAKDFKVQYPNAAIYEVNSGIYLVDAKILNKFLPLLSSQNANNEYYITDIIGLAKEKNIPLEAFCFENAEALLGVNNPLELYEAEKTLQQTINTKLMSNGVVLHNPESIRISPFVEIAAGVEIFGPCEIYGKSKIEQYTTIESHCVIKNTQIGEACTIKSFCHFEDAIVGNNAKLGPYARLRPQAELADNVHLGNFVEIKKSKIGNASKVNHLSYIGDSIVGSGVNVGAGCITCNYDGKNKFQTIIEDNAFLGSNCAFVAPVTIGKNTLVAAGSVITKDTPENTLAIARQRQTNLKKR